VTAGIRLEEGDSVEEILQVTSLPDLLVMGTYGRRGFELVLPAR
jgi:nucleotide-binding universal stress UspA family protein